MNEWDEELSVLRGIVSAAYDRERELPPDERRRDIEQITKGVLLLTTLPEAAFRVGLKHLRMDIQRKNLEKLPWLSAPLPEGRAHAAVCRELDRSLKKHGDQMGQPILLTGEPTTTWRQFGQQIEKAARYQLSSLPSWYAILMEEVGELLQADDLESARAEAVQVAAMAIRLIQRIDLELFEETVEELLPHATQAGAEKSVRVTAFADKPIASWETTEGGEHIPREVLIDVLENDQP